MTDKQKDLCLYRVSQAEDTIKSAQLCIENHLFKGWKYIRGDKSIFKRECSY